MRAWGWTHLAGETSGHPHPGTYCRRGRSEHMKQAMELAASSHKKFRDLAKGLQCHLACTRAESGDQLLTFLWRSIIKVIHHIENFTGLRVHLLNLLDLTFSLRKAPGYPLESTGEPWKNIDAWAHSDHLNCWKLTWGLSLQCYCTFHQSKGRPIEVGTRRNRAIA